MNVNLYVKLWDLLWLCRTGRQGATNLVDFARACHRDVTRELDAAIFAATTLDVLGYLADYEQEV